MNFHEKTARGYVENATRAWMEGRFDDAEWFERAVIKHRALAVAQTEPAKVEKKRCQHYGAIKEFFAVAREMGMDTTAKDRARGAVGMLLGKRVESRASLTGPEWSFATNALRMGKLTW